MDREELNIVGVYLVSPSPDDASERFVNRVNYCRSFVRPQSPVDASECFVNRVKYCRV